MKWIKKILIYGYAPYTSDQKKTLPFVWLRDEVRRGGEGNEDLRVCLVRL